MEKKKRLNLPIAKTSQHPLSNWTKLPCHGQDVCRHYSHKLTSIKSDMYEGKYKNNSENRWKQDNGLDVIKALVKHTTI